MTRIHSLDLNTISFIDQSPDSDLPFKSQPFGSGIHKVITIEEARGFEIPQLRKVPSEWLDSIQKVGLREICDLLEAVDVIVICSR
jgi:hypothetical protein